MLQATIDDCLSFDPFAFEEDGLGSSEVDVGRREIAQALVIAGMVVVSHEGRALTFEIAAQRGGLIKDGRVDGKSLFAAHFSLTNPNGQLGHPLRALNSETKGDGRVDALLPFQVGPQGIQGRAFSTKLQTRHFVP
jgi:hypothetical protein